MYKTIIELNENLSEEQRIELKAICERAHQNRVGTVPMKEKTKWEYVFEGDQKDYDCLQLGFLKMANNPVVLSGVVSWKWEDEDPDENSDLLEISLRYAV